MRYLILLLFIVYAGCSKENDFIPVYDVPEEFQPYVDAFLKDASDRGVALEINNLIIVFDQDLKSACGTCNYPSINSNVQKIITINPSAGCWSVAEGKEALMFHELGHCILGRPHNNDLLPNGDPKSIMVVENQKLYWPCIYDIDGSGGQDCNNTFKRKYYVDELFNENTQIPPWAL